MQWLSLSQSPSPSAQGFEEVQQSHILGLYLSHLESVVVVVVREVVVVEEVVAISVVVGIVVVVVVVGVSSVVLVSLSSVFAQENTPNVRKDRRVKTIRR